MPTIPVRSSSKKGKKPTLEALVGEKRKLDEETDGFRKEIKLSSSFDSKFWQDLRVVEEKRLESNRLQHKISMETMKMDYDDADAVIKWRNTEEGTINLQKEAALVKKVDLIAKHQAKLAQTASNYDTSLRRAFTNFFMGATTGLGLYNPRGDRPDVLQTQFRNELKELMGTRNTESSRHWWCPIQSRWTEAIVAGHLFPSMSGPEAMTAIFGETKMLKDKSDPTKGTSELYRAVNGILWSQAAETRFSLGYFVVVPDLDDNATPAEVQAWQEMPVKEYRIRVLRPNAQKMKEPIVPGEPKTWRDLDGKRLDFGEKKFRPRARYVYWTYISTMLKHAFNRKREAQANLPFTQIASQEVGKKYWGSTGSYIKKSQLLGFVEEMGHQYEHLLENAIEEEQGLAGAEGPDMTGLLVANENIIATSKTERELEEEEWEEMEKMEGEEEEKEEEEEGS